LKLAGLSLATLIKAMISAKFRRDIPAGRSAQLSDFSIALFGLRHV